MFLKQNNCKICSSKGIELFKIIYKPTSIEENYIRLFVIKISEKI